MTYLSEELLFEHHNEDIPSQQNQGIHLNKEVNVVEPSPFGCCHLHKVNPAKEL